MWVFLAIACAMLGFMLCALVEFFREGKRTTSNRQHSSNPNAGTLQSGRVVMIDSIQATQKHSSSKRYTAEWSHGHRKIQMWITCTDDGVVLPLLCTSPRPSSAISASPETVYKTVHYC